MKLIQALAFIYNLPRRKAETFIDDELVFVNEKLVNKYTFPVNIETDSIEIKGFCHRKESVKNLSKYYFIFNKPKGMEVSLNGKNNSISQIIYKIGIHNLKPAGRLDLDSEGLLILSNDGVFLNNLVHPKYHLPKIYEVLIGGLSSNEQLLALRELLNILYINKNETVLTIELKEGQNRQIRKNCAKCGIFIKRILRTAIGNIRLGNLEVSRWRPIQSDLVLNILNNEYTK